MANGLTVHLSFLPFVEVNLIWVSIMFMNGNIWSIIKVRE